MNEAKKHLLISLAIFAVAFLTLTIYIGANASGAIETMSALSKEESPAITTPENVEVQPVQAEINPQQAQTTPVAPEAVETYVEPSQPQNAPQSVSEPQLERIPFTNKPVQAGDPESYIGTYGQCPFYENAMEGKGCVPPPDIECNEDWSVCSYKGE